MDVGTFVRSIEDESESLRPRALAPLKSVIVTTASVKTGHILFPFHVLHRPVTEESGEGLGVRVSCLTGCGQDLMQVGKWSESARFHSR